MKKLKLIIAKGFKILFNPPALNSCKIDKLAAVCSGSELAGCEIGRYSYIGYRNFMVNTKIGAFCSIADRCSIGGAAHPLEFVSTSPVFHKGKNILKENFSLHDIPYTPKTVIENDVWIGQGAFIKAGVKISNGAVIGMGSVVTKDVGPYEIWAGNPAKMIRKRFDDNTIEKLLKTEWWNLPYEELKAAAQNFDDVKKFISKEENIRNENIAH